MTTTLTNIDFIVSATGSAPALDATPWLQALRAQVPVATCGGLPVLTPDLQWAPDVPLFVAGGLAALELGPTEGCRAAIKCLQMHCQLLKGSTSKEVLEVFYQEVGIRLIAYVLGSTCLLLLFVLTSVIASCKSTSSGRSFR